MLLAIEIDLELLFLNRLRNFYGLLLLRLICLVDRLLVCHLLVLGVHLVLLDYRPVPVVLLKVVEHLQLQCRPHCLRLYRWRCDFLSVLEHIAVVVSE